MVIYIDLVMIINFIFDFSILLVVDVLLKRHTKIPKVLLGALVGELSIVTLFLNINTLVLNVFKLLLSILMVTITFSYKDIKYTFYNTTYLYLTGIILGGFEQYLFNEFKIGSSYSLKYLFIIILAPLALYVYYKLLNRFKCNYQNMHTLIIKYDNHEFSGTAYLDSGNKLVSPISGKKIILIEKEYILYHKLKLTPIPYNALNHHGIIYCFKPDSVYVDDIEYKDLLVGLSEVKFNIDGCNALLNARMENL